MVFEDLQWADPGLLDFIDHLLEWSKAIRSHRDARATGAARRRPDWGAGRRNFGLALRSSRSPTRRCRAARGARPGAAGCTVEPIVERADGIPLYAVETVRMLVAEGRLVARTTPTGRSATVATSTSPSRSRRSSPLGSTPRPDRPVAGPGRARSLGHELHGRRRSPPSPARSRSTLEPRLRDLVRREFLELESDPRSPERGQYALRPGAHPRGRLRRPSRERDRRTRHLGRGAILRGLDDDELAGVLATHYLDAYRASPEGDEGAAVATQARIALRAAADRAAALHSHDQALAFLDQALEVTPDAADRVELLDRAGIAAQAAGRYEASMAHLREALELARGVGDQAAAARSMARIGELLLRGGTHRSGPCRDPGGARGPRRCGL